MNFVIIYNERSGKVLDVFEFGDDDFDEALEFSHAKMDEYADDPDIDVSLVGVEDGDINDLKRLYRAFFHGE